MTPINYAWGSTEGTISGENSLAVWTAPLQAVTAKVTVALDDGRGGTNTASIAISSQRNSPFKILVDATSDGGLWWFPQVPPFDSDAHHQGEALADYLRNRGFQVDELPRGITIIDSILNVYDKVIRAGSYDGYKNMELEDYDNFLKRSTRLLLISEYLRPGQRDLLAEQLGLPFRGIAKGAVARFGQHQITQNANPFFFNAGSVLLDVASAPYIEPLGWLADDVYVDLHNNDKHAPD